MSAPEDPNTNDVDPIEEAATALSAAIERLSARMGSLKQRARDAQDSVDASFSTDEDRARLAAELDASRAREAELEAAVETAATAVDAALAHLTASSGESGEVS